MIVRELAPIVLFVYNRPDHTRKTLEALAKNKLAEKSLLYIYSDGIKKNASQKEIQKVDTVKRIIRGVSDFKEVQITEREKNYGLAKNIIEGVTEVITRHGKAIILEDDIVTSPHFLEFMNDALDKYEDIKKVMHISGFLFEHKGQEKLPDTFFLKFMACWGWATWAYRWELFIDDSSRLLRKLKENNSLREFNLDGVIDFDKQLKNNIEGKIDTWAIKWFTTIFLNDGLCLYPRQSFVRNIGLDGTGVHFKKKANNEQNKAFIKNTIQEKIHLHDIPIKESDLARNYIKDYFRSEGRKMDNRNFLSINFLNVFKKKLQKTLFKIIR